MAELQPIRIGAILKRTYFFYDPLDSDPTQPDYDKPRNLSNDTIVFVIENGNNTFTFSGSPRVVVTSLLGKVVVKIPAADTISFSPLPAENSSYLEFTDAAGDKTPKVVRAEMIVEKGSV
jgi:hypothetical protein